jgi:hypothetical protein
LEKIADSRRTRRPAMLYVQDRHKKSEWPKMLTIRCKKILQAIAREENFT